MKQNVLSLSTRTHVETENLIQTTKETNEVGHCFLGKYLFMNE